MELGFIQKITARLHENIPIVQIFGYEYIENRLYYVMEIGMCSLDEYYKKNFKKIDDLERFYHFWTIYSYILKALLFLESIKIVHRDIKPQNFVLFKSSNQWGYDIKLIDFGTVRILSPNPLTITQMADTYAYMLIWLLKHLEI